MQVFHEINNRHITGLIKDFPIEITHRPGSPSIARIAGGGNIAVGCISCRNPRCIKFDTNSIKSNISEFASDNTNNVCPVNAISWNSNLCIPHIDIKKCLKCGICARACPLGAIYYDGDKFCVSRSDSTESASATEANFKKQERQLQEVLKITVHHGWIISQDDKSVATVYKKLRRLSGNTPNLMVRNLLVALGNNCTIGRVGDVYTRMDALFETPNGKRGVVEVEFGRDTLDAVRGILDDIAVACCRYGIPKNENIALVICLSFPNERQGYWQVVKDIQKVENIAINTITIGALLLLLWGNKTIDISDSYFYADYDNMSIRRAVERQLGTKTTLSKKKNGILEPEK